MTGYAHNKPVSRDKPHHYIFDVYSCPVCGSTRTERTRMPGKKPRPTKKNPFPTYRIHDDRASYDYCDAL